MILLNGMTPKSKCSSTEPRMRSAKSCRSSGKHSLSVNSGKLKLLDLGCGTGRFLDSVKQVWPRLPTIGLDTSEAYIRHAKRELNRWGLTRFIVGKGEATPLPVTA
jgi:ubiquinone/menaquinone biosynthesis C-methylase UbiE